MTHLGRWALRTVVEKDVFQREHEAADVVVFADLVEIIEPSEHVAFGHPIARVHALSDRTCRETVARR